MTDRRESAAPATAGLPPRALAGLRQTFRGDIVLPGDASYDDARRVHSLLVDLRPAVIVRPQDADDVAAAVRFAVGHDLPIAVRGGGHSGPGFGTVDGGLVLDMSSMRGIEVDPDARFARVEAGTRAGELTSAVIAHGLIVPFGDSPDVGVAGITLGGGVGWLTRLLGMTIDSLLAVDMVMADGRRLRVSETEHPDLFWAVRGGGGNFGVVTHFEFRLHPIDTVLGGIMLFPATRATIRGVLDLSQNAPDALSTISVVMIAPPMPGIPPELVGQLIFMVQPVWAGDLAEGERVLADFRALDTPLVDAVHPMPFSGMYEMSPPDEAYSAITRGFMADAIDDSTIDAMLAAFEPSRLPSPEVFAAVQLRVLGGAMARVPAEATAFAHRDANLLIAAAIIGFDPAEEAAHARWADAVFAEIGRSATGAYLNFLDDEGEARVRAAYPESTYRRLAEVKRRYDPDNRFHVNHNIRPAS